MWRRRQLAAEAYLGEIIVPTRSAPTVSRRAPAGPDRAGRITRHLFGAIGRLAILLGLVTAIEVAAFGPLRSAPAPAVVYVVVLHVSAYGHRGVIVPENPEYRIAFERLADCLEAAPTIARAVKIPAVANLDAVECQRMEIRR